MVAGAPGQAWVVLYIHGDLDGRASVRQSLCLRWMAQISASTLGRGGKTGMPIEERSECRHGSPQVAREIGERPPSR